MVRDIDWSLLMLKRLQNNLRIFLIMIFMVVISLILCFFFWTTWQDQQIADIAYIQRMASLLIYQLEADPESPDELLSNYEQEMNVYSILKDKEGHILFQSKPDTRTDLDTLIRIAEKSIEIQYPAEQTTISSITEQGGYGKITGNDHDSYYVIPSNIHTKAGNIYSLVLFYEPSSISSLLLQQLPAYATIWLLAFILILLASRFLLHRAFEPTEQVLQSHKDFIAAASHELKSPLAVIMANIESIHNSEIKEPQTQNSLKVIDAECIRMSRLVRDMLLLASSDADKWTIHTQEVNIDTLLIMLYEAYDPICRKNSIHLDLNLDAESYPQIYTDQERVFQVLSIFLDNAVSYSKENSNIEILTSQTSKEFTFLVVDHGCGIAEKDKPFIFDRFYCADKSRTNKAHFGLGLSIAKELAKMLSGKIGFSDTSGGGTTFFLTLPIK
jgi:two-component system sensor histidine kinase CiaH